MDLADMTDSRIFRVPLVDLEGATDKPVRPGILVRWDGALWSVLATSSSWADLHLIGR